MTDVNSIDILNLSAVELRDAIAVGEISSVRATRACLDAIGRHDAAVGAYLEVFAGRALERAAAVDAAIASDRAAGRSAFQAVGPLAGVPVAVADNLCTAFGHTTCASKMLTGFQSPFSAWVVTKLEAAGAVVLGKTNLDEFGMGSSTEHSHAKPTRNPWDLARVPGTSGGAAAVAGRLAAAAIGGDTGGGVRQPAAFCGLVGLKPTYGRVSRFGLAEYGSSLEQIGPMARDVADAALLLSVLAGHDANDATSVPQAVPDYLAALDQPPTGLRIGLPREFFDGAGAAAGALDAEILAVLKQAVEAYRTTGATLVDVSLPHGRVERDAHGNLYSHAAAAFAVIVMAEATSNLARYGGMHFGHRTEKPCGDIHELYARNRAEGFGDEVKRQILLGTHMLTAGHYDAYYTKACQARRLVKNGYTQAFTTCDVLLCPTTPTLPFALGEKTADLLAMLHANLYTCGANLAGLPAVSIPAGVSKSGLPIGVQLIGQPFREDVLLRVARLHETATGVTRLRPAAQP